MLDNILLAKWFHGGETVRPQDVRGVFVSPCDCLVYRRMPMVINFVDFRTVLDKQFLLTRGQSLV